MRVNTQKQLKLHMLMVWLIGCVIVFAAFLFTHDRLSLDDYTVIIIILSSTGALLWHYCHDVYKYLDLIYQRKREKTHQ